MKRPSQLDVAKAAGVSRATVSLVLNGVTNGNVVISDETRKRVWDAIEELGYVPDARARALRSGDTKTLGLIIPDIRNPHFWETAEGVEQEARDAGYHLLLSNIAFQYGYAHEIFADLLHRRIDGLIMMGSFTFASEEANAYLSRFFKRHLPIVEICDYYSLHYEVDRVSSDYRTATQEAMAYLLGMNHRRIGMIYGIAMPVPALDRLQPYQECLRLAGLPLEEDLIVHCGPTIEEGYQAALKLLTLSPRPTAIIAINDLLAIGALRAIADCGLSIPADISLLSYDDIHVAQYMVPRLTTVSKDVLSLGRKAVRLLVARLQKPDSPYQTEKHPARLIIRESTGPAPV
ncbi:MAG: LacI family DNA-binding transcriptional regulator [Anaerolineae bacterium]|nr:LacI family DNA-binding transcriptional regulator [Anaerolineae bacterium]